MTGRGRKAWARAAVCAAALATPLAVSGCQSTGNRSTGAPSGAVSGSSSSAVQSASSSSASSPSSPSSSAPSSAPSILNATSGTGLTVSDGSSKILMNGRAVDFGTEVHDPSWSADGKRVLFIDGDGNLMIANADGSGKTVIAQNPGGAKWSHPTWQVVAADAADGLSARAAYFFASTANGTTTLQEVTVGANGAPTGQPKQLPLNGMAGGPNAADIPQTGNTWPSGSGKQGAAVYENDHGQTSDLYFRDDNLRQQTGLDIKNGSEPDYVVTGTSAGSGWVTDVVFLRTVGGIKHVFEEDMQAENALPRDLTPNATMDCSAPALSPDGTMVAFSTPSGVETVSATGSGTPKHVTDAPGFPAFRAS